MYDQKAEFKRLRSLLASHQLLCCQDYALVQGGKGVSFQDLIIAMITRSSDVGDSMPGSRDDDEAVDRYGCHTSWWHTLVPSGNQNAENVMMMWNAWLPILDTAGYREIFIFSDGCRRQFKCRRMMHYWMSLKKQYPHIKYVFTYICRKCRVYHVLT